jgi:hypothetical protein
MMRVECPSLSKGTQVGFDRLSRILCAEPGIMCPEPALCALSLS